MTTPTPTLTNLRAPFPENQISKLPKETGNQAKQRKADQEKGVWPQKCPICGGYHHKNAVHLDYVGHAALTDRLLDTDPEWSWEPVSFGPDGLPAFDRNGGLWIRLTVLGVSRLGYGDADGKQGGNAVKEAIGDALRNAAMRFGAALDLWHKGDLHISDDGDESKENSGQAPLEAGMPADAWAKLVQMAEASGTQSGELIKRFGVKNLRLLTPKQYDDAIEFMTSRLAETPKQTSNKTLADELDGGDIPF